MPRGSITKRGQSYSIRWRDPDGRQRWKTIGTNKHEAERALTHVLKSLDDGTYKDLTPIGFADFAALWLKHYCEVKVGDATYSDYEGSFRNHLAPFFGNAPLTKITPDMVQAYVSHKVGEGVLAAKTINNTLIPLRECFKHATIWGYLRENPARFVEKPRVEKNEMEFYTPEEARSLLEAIPEPFYAFFLTALSTGLRQGELLGLTRPCVDLGHSQIRVRWQLNRQGKLVRPKTNAALRTISIGPELSTRLERHMESLPPSDLDLVFCTEKGKPLNQSNIEKRVFKPAVAAAGIKKIRFHDLRHTYACWLASRGENIKYIQTVMGHASITTTLNTYGHLLPDTGAGVAERHEAQLFGRIGVQHVSSEKKSAAPRLDKQSL